MNLQLRDKLRLPASCGEKELREACNRYYRIYTGVRDNTTDPYVKKIAEAKLADLVTSAAKEGITVDGVTECDYTGEKTASTWDVEKQFSTALTEDGILTPSQHSKLSKLISELPESAKKNYLQFNLIKNYEGITEKSVADMNDCLMRAVNEDPQNPVYTELQSLLKDALETYKKDKQTYENEKAEKLRRIRRIERIKKAFKLTGRGIWKLAGWYFALMAGLLACFCECFGDC